MLLPFLCTMPKSPYHIFSNSIIHTTYNSLSPIIFNFERRESHAFNTSHWNLLSKRSPSFRSHPSINNARNVLPKKQHCTLVTLTNTDTRKSVRSQSHRGVNYHLHRTKIQSELLSSQSFAWLALHGRHRIRNNSPLDISTDPFYWLEFA